MRELDFQAKTSDALISDINKDPSKKHLWISLFEVFLEEHRFGEAANLISIRQQKFRDALSYSYDVLLRMAVNERGDILEPFIAALGQGHLIYPVTLFVRGVLAASREKPAEAAGLFKAAVNAVSAIVSVAQHDPEFTSASFHHMLN